MDRMGRRIHGPVSWANPVRARPVRSGRKGKNLDLAEHNRFLLLTFGMVPGQSPDRPPSEHADGPSRHPSGLARIFQVDNPRGTKVPLNLPEGVQKVTKVF